MRLLALIMSLSLVGLCGDWVLESGSRAQIILPDSYAGNAGVEAHLREVAGVLQASLKEGVGAEAVVVREGEASPQVKSIYLGATRALSQVGVDVTKFEYFNGIILEKDGKLFIAGYDRHRYGLDKPERSYLNYILGTVKAAVVFMEDYLGTRFLLPGEAGIDFQKRDRIMVPGGLRREVTPRLIFATGRHSSLLYDYANNNFGRSSFHTYGGHSFYDACPASKYAKSNPEYFALIGNRRSGDGGHLCISNKQVQELIYQEALKRLDQGATAVQVAQTDGYVPCECKQCKEYGNTDDEGEKIWILELGLAKRLLKDRPGKMLHLLCYPPNQDPPKTFSEFPDNVIIEMCRYSQADFDAWKSIKVPQGFTTYIYNWGWYQSVGITPKTTPRFVANQVKLFAANNVKGIYRCGFGELFGTEGPAYYVFGKMLDNPDGESHVLADEFYRRAYGPAYAPMAAFFDLLYTRLNQLYLPNVGSRRTDGLGGIPKNRTVILSAIYSPDLINSMEKNLARAEKMAPEGKIASRLRLVRKEFEYLKSLGNTLAAYNMYQTDPNQASFKVLADRVLQRNKLIDSCYDGKNRMVTFKEFGGIPFLGSIGKSALMVNGRLGAPVGAPLTWNVERLLEIGVLPGTSYKSMQIRRVDGDPDNDASAGGWKDASWQSLAGIQLADTKAQARFKVVYDDKALYFACEAKVIPGQDYLELGKDGPCWRQDCLEFMLDPSGDRQTFYHLIINPVAGSYFDARFGYVTDPLHPLYRESDKAWDGKWSFTTNVEGDTWRSFVTIPFETLGEKPTSGTNWTMNVGMEAYTPLPKDFVGHGEKKLELLLWSPNMETMKFQEPEIFGDVVFE